MAQSAGAAEYTDYISAEGFDSLDEGPGNDTKQSDGWGASNARPLGNAEYPFYTMAPWSTLARNGSTW